MTQLSDKEHKAQMADMAIVESNVVSSEMR